MLILTVISLFASSPVNVWAVNNSDNTKELGSSSSLMSLLQNKRVSIDIQNEDFITILMDICNQAGVKYAIEGNIKVDKSKKYSLVAQNVTVEDALNKLMSNTGYAFTLDSNVIKIVKAAVAAPITATMQQNPIELQGKVVDPDGKPIIGATVISVSGVGTITDNNGAFTLTLPRAEEIEVSCVGYVTLTQTITEPNNKQVIAMQRDEAAVEDVVVNGVFVRKANTFTGAVTSLNSEEIKRVGNSNLLQSLKNLDASIMFIDNLEAGSDPNSTPEMVMRGKSSLDFGDSDLKATYQSDPNAPLFVLDGFEVSITKIMDLDMDRVESVTILKDASAKAIYGSKAANGVIVVELKKTGSEGIRVTYSGSVEIQAPDLTSYNLTNAAEKLDVELAYGMFIAPDGSNTNTQLALNQLYNQKRTFVESGIDTDWLSKPLQLGVGTKHGVSAELGEGSLRAIVDLSYHNVKGAMKTSDRTNISGGVTLSLRHKKFLFRNQLTVTSNKANDSKYGTFGEYARINPYYTPYDQDGNLLENIVASISSSLPNDVIVSDWYGDLTFQANPLYNASLNTILQSKYL